jgi:ABC-2 type transport system ATP-binding protein
MLLLSDGAPGLAIDAVDVAKSFGSVTAIERVDLQVRRGETVALLGPNGAGKSTTLELLLGLVQADRGSIVELGVSPSAAVDAGAVSGMLQSGSLVRDLTVGEVVTMIASLYPNPLTVDDALAIAGIGDLAGRRAHRLSGGQTQRVRFAIAIVSNPDLLVLDEPTVAMDVESRHEFWKAIRHFADGGKTVVFATHHLEEADAWADRIVLMAAGLIVADGSATEIKARVGVRTIRATLPAVDINELAAITGVHRAERHGDAVTLTSVSSDDVLRRLLDRYPTVRDVEVRGAGLEEAFLELTATGASMIGEVGA